MKKKYITPQQRIITMPQQLLMQTSEPKVNSNKYSDTTQGTLAREYDFDEE